ncbi:unnamed protein product [Linum tenue]|uniref:C2 domain-containing protein n=1 Tax=Linum tenue TaxID=586396 RepID=A0AAV0Q8L0_9ROSI|nr:unnamed protein product [Linum tenue]
MDDDGDGLLQIYVHHARNIHNICIYDNQDVYAKFSLTYNPDDTVSTRIVNGGGKNPEFNQRLAMKVAQSDAVLKCEIWMLSRARNLMEDQLLGFALVPISGVVGKGQVSADYSLSSTDLFHSPAGTVKLTLCLSPSAAGASGESSNCSISSEVVLLDRRISEVVALDPVEYSRIEFPDIRVAKQNQEMVTEYFHRKLGSFLHLGNSPVFHDCEMTAADGGSISPAGSVHVSSGFLSSTTTSLSDDRNSSDSKDKKGGNGGGGGRSSSSAEGNQSSSSSGGCPDTPTSRKGSEIRDRKEGREEGNGNSIDGGGKYGKVGPPALVPDMNLEAEQSAMQQQIVDMYMRSMQQFTESLAKMKLPMDLDKPRSAGGGDLSQSQHQQEQQQKKKKDGSRVFYGSRAFF